MEKEYSIWKEYIITGDKVNISDYNGHLHIFELFPNIDEVLLLENRAILIYDNYNNYAKHFKDYFNEYKSKDLLQQLIFAGLVAFGGGVAGVYIDSKIALYSSGMMAYMSLCYIKEKLDGRNFRINDKGLLAVSQLCSYEINKCSKSKEELLEENIDYSSLVRDEVIPVKDDSDYESELIDRLDKFSNYGKMERKLKSKYNKGKLDNYLDSIGCSHDDKLIFKELLGIGNTKTTVAQVQYTKR